MNLKLIELVLSDLMHLREEWHDMSDDKLRRNSNVLRSLLLHKNLQKAWNEFQFEKKFVVRAPNLEKLKLMLPPNKISFATAGGARYGGIIISETLLIGSGLTDYEMGWFENYSGPPNIESLTLEKYNESTVMIINGHSYNRREIIDFVANKLGGTHFDQTRNEKQKLLEDSTDPISIGTKNAIYFELLSAGQHLINSSHTRYLITRMKYAL